MDQVLGKVFNLWFAAYFCSFEARLLLIGLTRVKLLRVKFCSNVRNFFLIQATIYQILEI